MTFDSAVANVELHKIIRDRVAILRKVTIKLNLNKVAFKMNFLFLYYFKFSSSFTNFDNECLNKRRDDVKLLMIADMT